jgi:type II secretory pathway pseudopilin PulG
MLDETKPIRPRSVAPLIVGLIIAICLGGLALIGLLAVMLLPTFTTAKKAAQRTLTISNVKQIQIGMLIYTSDHDDFLPLDMSNTRSVSRALAPYTVKARAIWRSENPASSEFAWNSALAAKKVSAVPNQENTAVVFDSAPWGRSRSKVEDGYVVGFLDGGAHMRSQEDFDRGRAARWVFPARRVNDSTPKTPR